MCVCMCMLKESDKDRALLKRKTALATLPLCRLQISRITPQHQSRDQSCWEPEEMGEWLWVSWEMGWKGG